MVKTLAELRTMARERCDREDSANIVEAEENRYINAAISDLYDELVVRSPQDFYLASTTIPLVGGQQDYDLPDDFYVIRGIDWPETSNEVRTILPFNFLNRNTRQGSSATPWSTYRYRVHGSRAGTTPGAYTSKLRISPVPSGTAGDMTVHYIPKAPVLSNDTDQWGGLGGWAIEYVVYGAAVRICDKEQDEQAIAMMRGRDAALEKGIAIISGGRTQDATPRGQLPEWEAFSP